MPSSPRKSATVSRKRPSKRRDRVSEKVPRKTQRERLLDAMIELSAQVGYLQVSIAQVSAKAGVSSATFYEQFTDKEDCLLAAYWATARRLVGPLQLQGGSDWREVAKTALGELLGALRADPAGGRLLLVESRAAGPRMREERERALDLFEQRIEDSLESTRDLRETLDVPAMVLVGGVRSIAVWRLRSHAEDELPGLVDDLLEWMASYATPAKRGRWSLSAKAIQDTDLAALALPTSGALERLPRGRHGLPPGVVARSQRTRIVYGTAQVMTEKGFANATVSDIVTAAGVSREVFYEHFTDKLHAFLEAQRYSTQEILDACAAAYFSAEEWPERVWKALRMLIGLIVSHPSLSYLRLVECYAAGPAALSRTEDITKSFTVFLEEGFRYRPEAAEVPRVCTQAIAGAIFEVIYRHVARGETAALGEQLPRLAYVVLAPFTGSQEAIRLVTQLTARQVRGGHRGNRDRARARTSGGKQA